MKYYEILWNIMKYYEILWNIMKYYEILWNIMKYYEILWNIMKYYEYDCSWLPQFWGRHGEGYKNASATMRLLETGQPHEMRLWHESIESYVPTLLCSTAEQQRSKKFGNWLASWIQLVLHLRRGKPIGGGAVLERVIGPISAWMGCFWHNGTRREIACEADQWLSLVNQEWPPQSPAVCHFAIKIISLGYTPRQQTFTEHTEHDCKATKS